MSDIIFSQISLSEIISQVKQAVKDEMSACVPGADPINKPLNTKELCEFLDVTEPTIIRWRKKGKIPFMQIGTAVRFDLNKVIKALEKK